ncbi:MAG TPA: hypothetical protein VJS68_03805 [Thermoplasmata archaeon]|nr:hypothetical protein [Thermoplasmata archaeon]
MAKVWPLLPETRSESGTAQVESTDGFTLTLLSLVLCLAGFIGVAALLFAYKFEGVGPYWHHIATRDLFVVSLGLTASPFLLAVVRRVPLVLVILPVILVVFLYPLFSPYGIPYSRDAVFNFSFAQSLLTTGTWQPTLDVAGQAVTYSYYPAGAVYNAELASFTGLPILATFNWSFPLFRLLVLPGAVYTIGRQLFGPRTAVFGTFLYLAIPSIEFGLPTQQDFGVPYFALVVMGLSCLSVAKQDRDALFVVTVLFAISVILTHHVSGYVMGLWLLAMSVLPLLLRKHAPFPQALVPYVFLAAFFVWDAYAILVATPVLVLQSGLLKANLAGVLHPTPGNIANTPGTTFPTYQLVWIGVSIFVVILGAWFTFRDRFRQPQHSFSTFAILSSLVVGVLALPFVSTGFSFLSLRLMEYIGVVLCPAAAWWMLNRFTAAAQRYVPGWTARIRPPRNVRRVARIALPVALGFLVFTGGALIPLTTRDQFATSSSILIDSPRYVDTNALAAAQWADAHFNRSHGMWGDELASTTFGGFGHFVVHWNGYPLFNGSGFNRSALSHLTVGDYVVIDAYVTTADLPPEFDRPANEQPTAAIPVADIEKFYNPFFFSEIYQNSVFTIFEVERIPPPS